MSSPGNDGKASSSGGAHENKEEIIELFWQLSDKKTDFRSFMKGLLLKPENYHNWAIENDIINRSPTLRSLCKVHKPVEPLQLDVTNYKETFNKVLSELKLKFGVVRIPTRHLRDYAFIYQVHSTPPWCFRGLADTEEKAIQEAAQKGLEFFVFMSA